MTNESKVFEIILMVIVVGLIIGYASGLISFGKQTTTPTQEELPQIAENQSETGEVLKFQQCITASDCNWDHTKYYNRNCEFSGRWRCMPSPVVGESFCSYGCYINDTIGGWCGDGICGGMIEGSNEDGVESEVSCWDCDKDVASLGKLVIG